MTVWEWLFLGAVVLICWTPVVVWVVSEICRHFRTRAAIRRMEAHLKLDLTNPTGRSRLGIEKHRGRGNGPVQ